MTEEVSTTNEITARVLQWSVKLLMTIENLNRSIVLFRVIAKLCILCTRDKNMI